MEVRAPLTLVPAAMAPLALAVWHPRWAPYWELGPAGHRLPSRTEFRSDPARAQVTACWTVTTEDGPGHLSPRAGRSLSALPTTQPRRAFCASLSVGGEGDSRTAQRCHLNPSPTS